ncbi:hypothetical protein GGE68_005480 [Rhizobium leguminosarum]|nr:hypothetical protein [Rhizobium leguminosarum]
MHCRNGNAEQDPAGRLDKLAAIHKSDFNRSCKQDDGGDNRQNDQRTVVADRHRTGIGQHRDKMGCPGAGAENDGSGDEPIVVMLLHAFLRTCQHEDGRQAAEAADRQGDEKQRPVMLVGDT